MQRRSMVWCGWLLVVGVAAWSSTPPVASASVDQQQNVEDTLRGSSHQPAAPTRDQSRDLAHHCTNGRCRKRHLRRERRDRSAAAGSWNNSFRFVTPPTPQEGGAPTEPDHDPAETESADDIQTGVAIVIDLLRDSGDDAAATTEEYHPSSYLATTWTFQHTITDVDVSSTESQDDEEGEEPVMGAVTSLKEQDPILSLHGEDMQRHETYPWAHSSSSTSTVPDELTEEEEDTETILFDSMPEPTTPIVPVLTDTRITDTAAAACQPPLSARDRRLQLEALITQSITPRDILYDTTSPHNAAFHWLVYDDTAVVCPEATKDATQRYILAVLYYSMGQWDPSCRQGECEGQDAFLSGSNVCQWEYVVCPRGSGNVVALDVGSTDTVGSLPLELSNFGVLHSLSVSGNTGLRGRIPVSYGNFGVIRNLHLRDNELSGNVPTQLCKLITLETLDVAGNHLSGQVPSCLGTPGNLLSIDMSRNLLSGAIPSTLFDSIGCHTLHLHNNNLNGTIPEEIGSFVPADDISLHRNQLTGTLPSSIQLLENLRILSLYGNEMTGPIPSELGQLGQLEQLFLHDNDFTGVVPDTICNLRLDRGGSLAHLTADCGKAGKVDCDCCTACF